KPGLLQERNGRPAGRIFATDRARPEVGHGLEKPDRSRAPSSGRPAFVLFVFTFLVLINQRHLCHLLAFKRFELNIALRLAGFRDLPFARLTVEGNLRRDRPHTGIGDGWVEVADLPANLVEDPVAPVPNLRSEAAPGRFARLHPLTPNPSP